MVRISHLLNFKSLLTLADNYNTKLSNISVWSVLKVMSFCQNDEKYSKYGVCTMNYYIQG